MFRKTINPLLIISLIYTLLLVPEAKLMINDFPSSLPFRWNNDLRFKTLEANFAQNKTIDKDQLSNEVDSLMVLFKTTTALLDSQQYSPAHPIFETIENELFNISTKIVYTPEKLRTFTQIFEETRYLLKKQSRDWIIDNVNSKNTLYRILYGGRTAIEEIELQVEEKYKTKLSLGFAEPSKTPSHKTHDFILHSGDILVSRGGAATSALISRGSNYPGNFSHVALVYIDDQTNKLHIIESHIERGVVVSTPEEYLEDKKFRIMVLRPRSDLPQLKNNPLLPHLAAKEAYEEAMSQHIPYDFAMDYSNSDEKFCSEVASSVYAQNGINLWLDLSSISSPGIKTWLSDFGVKNFITQEPSDLEYDPQLTVVAEWRDQETLFNDHMDNAIVDILIEDANLGEKLDYNWYLLPFARIAKSYSWALNQFGITGPIPEGMTATGGLKNNYYTNLHAEVKTELMPLIANFKQKNGYQPPYWQLVTLAREAKDKLLKKHSPPEEDGI